MATSMATLARGAKGVSVLEKASAALAAISAKEFSASASSAMTAEVETGHPVSNSYKLEKSMLEVPEVSTLPAFFFSPSLRRSTTSSDQEDHDD